MKRNQLFVVTLLLGCFVFVFGLSKTTYAETSRAQQPFLQNLRLGATGNDVQRLQEYLNSHGASVAPSGPGSSGNETRYFGPATARAVSHFQELHAGVILSPLHLTKGTGNFYAATRNFVNQTLEQTSTLSTSSNDPKPRLSGLIVVQKPRHAIGGTISGLSGTVVLQNNGINDLSISANGLFTFTRPIIKGASYNITVSEQPGGQTCIVTNGTGIIGRSKVGNVSVSCSVALVSITVTPSNSHLPSNINEQFTATGHYADSSTADITISVAWDISDQAVAVINSTGLATGIAPGIVQVGATLNGVLGTTTLTVTDATLVSITISPSNPAVARGDTLQLSAIGTFSDGSPVDITNQVIWASMTTGVATVNNMDHKGEVTGVAGGTSSIHADMNAIAGTATLHVGP